MSLSWTGPCFNFLWLFYEYHFDMALNSDKSIIDEKRQNRFLYKDSYENIPKSDNMLY